MAALSPSPVMVLTPVFGAAAIASCPFCFSFSMTFDPFKPAPADDDDLHGLTSLVDESRPLNGSNEGEEKYLHINAGA
jgi:hypothetical protein